MKKFIFTVNNVSRFRSAAILLAALIVAASLFGIGLKQIRIDTNIIASLPRHDPVINDARTFILNHPIQDRIAIDVSIDETDPDVLIEIGDELEKRLSRSGLFLSVGIKDNQRIFPELISGLIRYLPVLFDEKELNEKIAPLLDSEQMDRAFQDIVEQLSQIGGIGQAELISKDPLQFRNLILAKLIHLAPTRHAEFYRGHLISKDKRHLLVIAKPKTSGTDTAFSRRVAALIEDIQENFRETYASRGIHARITPVGAYRAALDNEMIARKDTQRAIWISTVCIALLLLLAFPRPYLGILSLFPAIVGTLIAFFVYSLFHDTVSVLALGFGGAIISITVDHGIAYLLFLDRPHETQGRQAAREVLSVGLLATLTTIGAFLSLSFSGFPILAQIGQFTAFGIFFSFLTVHTIFPVVFPKMTPAKTASEPFLWRIADYAALSGKKIKLIFAAAWVGMMLWIGFPEFKVDLASMNSVRKETREAEKLISETWGNMLAKVYVMIEADSLTTLQDRTDGVTQLFQKDMERKALESTFTSSVLFPGTDRAKQNFSDWKNFWDASRLDRLKTEIQQKSLETGFAPDAFSSFFDMIEQNEWIQTEIPNSLLDVLSITFDAEHSSWIQFCTLTPGKSYNAETFYDRLTALEGIRLFDPRFFSERLGKVLAETFIRMAAIIGISVVSLLLIFFLSIRLTCIALLPIGFAFISTLGTMKLIGHSLDIPGLMLSIVILGMGIDYSLFFVCAYQRYGDDTVQPVRIVRVAVLLASATSLIGFGVLSLADHFLLKSVGLTSFLGIAYALIGTFFILPPILTYHKHTQSKIENQQSKIFLHSFHSLILFTPTQNHFLN